MPSDMLPPADICYQALISRDPRFDGVYYVGIKTTRVYCRFVCPAKNPRPENCTYFRSAAAAERAGYRPCLRCRPELAPGNAQIDSVSRLAVQAASRIEDGALAERSVRDLARDMGISDRHLRRVVEAEFGVTPVELAQTHRLLLAKRLLTDTDLPAIEVAYASGFSSVRRFNALFKDRYNLNPMSLRKHRTQKDSHNTIRAEIAFRAPFDWASLLDFLRPRLISGVEHISANNYLRTAGFGTHSGWIAVEPIPGRNRLAVDITTTLAPVLPKVLAAVKRLFDLLAEPDQIARDLGELSADFPGLRVPGAFDSFEVAVRAVIGQQVSVKAATTLAGRFASAFGTPIDTDSPYLTHLTPTAQRLSALEPEDIERLGIIHARAEAIRALAGAVAARDIVLEPAVDVERTIPLLKCLPGIGDWTAQYIAMRALSWPDAFPAADLGLRKALCENDPKRVGAVAEQWRPWRAYAAMHLWKSLEKNSCPIDEQALPAIRIA